MSDDTYYKNSWFQIWKSYKFGIEFSIAGYFDPHPTLYIGFIFFAFVFKFPFITKYYECDPPSYGIYIFEHTLNIHWGRKTILWWELPFVSWKLVEHCVDVKNKGFVDAKIIRKENPNDYYDNDWRREHYNSQVIPYVDSYDGEVVNATIWKEYRTWKRKWLTWLPFWEDKHNYIEIIFDKEVGKEKGSWKGGCIGCGYDLLPGEDPVDCLKRMEKERKF